MDIVGSVGAVFFVRRNNRVADFDSVTPLLRFDSDDQGISLSGARCYR